MSDADRWARPLYEAGGGAPELFFASFGPVPQDWSISGSTYRTGGIPEGITLSTYGPGSNPEVVDSFRDGYLWNTFAKTHAEAAAATASETSCVVIRGAVVQDDSLAYLRDVVGVLTWLLDQGHKAIWDPYGFQWWAPGDWRARVFEASGVPWFPQVSILVSDEPDGMWFHTRGMIKFGRPDLSLRRVTEEQRALATTLINRFVEMQARGGVIPEGAEIKVPDAPDGMICRHGGHMDDPEFNNRHVEIHWPG